MSAQIHEVGVFLGGSNYVGDVGSTAYVAPKEPAFGILYKWNKSPRHAFRFSYTQSKIVANDLDSNEPGRNGRGYSFENNIKEVSLGLEFNFFDFNLQSFEKKFTPYVYSGLSYVLPSSLNFKATTNYKSASTLAIPMTVGVKSNIWPKIIVALEVGARYTYNDNLDASYAKGFGNINNNDWYVFSGITLTYTFGITPCYCAK
jgi:hypothetical protein